MIVCCDKITGKVVKTMYGAECTQEDRDNYTVFENVEENIQAGNFIYADGEFIQDNFLEENGIKNTRDELLRLSDWTQLPDAPLHEYSVELYREYRKQLRDLPYKGKKLSEIRWPKEPK